MEKSVDCKVVNMEDQYWFPLCKILSKFSTKELLEWRVTSKGWRFITYDHSFVHTQLKNLEPLHGFFYQNRPKRLGNDPDLVSYLPISGTTTHNNLLEFLPERVTVLNSSCGLIGCRSSTFTSHSTCLYVCNVVNKQWIRIDWPNPSLQGYISFVFDPLRHGVVSLRDFKIVIVSRVTESRFSFNIYFSLTKQWRRSKEVCVCIHSLAMTKGCVCLNGVLYYLTTGKEVLMFDPSVEKSWLVKPPFPAHQTSLTPEMCLGESAGAVYLALISEHGLQLWVLLNHTASQWNLIITSTLEEMDSGIQTRSSMANFEISRKMTYDHLYKCSWWVELLAMKDNILLFRIGTDLYMYNFQEKMIGHVSRLQDLGQNFRMHAIVCPYTLSLVPLPEGRQIGEGFSSY